MTAAATLPRTAQGQVLSGQYSGAYRSPRGKLTGMVLQTADSSQVIHLPKYLRPMLVRELLPKTFIQVMVLPQAEPGDAPWRAVDIRILTPAEVEMLRLVPVNDDGATAEANSPPIATTAHIQVCTKGKCYRQGGQHLWQALQDHIESHPEYQSVELVRTGCMKACQHGPNLRVLPQGRSLHRVQPHQAAAVLEALAIVPPREKADLPQTGESQRPCSESDASGSQGQASAIADSATHERVADHELIPSC